MRHHPRIPRRRGPTNGPPPDPPRARPSAFNPRAVGPDQIDTPVSPPLAGLGMFPGSNSRCTPPAPSRASVHRPRHPVHGAAVPPRASSPRRVPTRVIHGASLHHEPLPLLPPCPTPHPARQDPPHPPRPCQKRHRLLLRPLQPAHQPRRCPHQLRGGTPDPGHLLRRPTPAHWRWSQSHPPTPA